MSLRPPQGSSIDRLEAKAVALDRPAIAPHALGERQPADSRVEEGNLVAVDCEIAVRQPGWHAVVLVGDDAVASILTTVDPDIDQGDPMGEIVVSQFVTVDGVMEDPGGSEGMERGGWAFQFNRGKTETSSSWTR